jgi:hypothetical protein
MYQLNRIDMDRSVDREERERGREAGREEDGELERAGAQTRYVLAMH